MNKFVSYTDESGQDTNGEYFLVSTMVIKAEYKEKSIALLEKLEKESKKSSKWSKTGTVRRKTFVSLVLKNVSELNFEVYYSEFKKTTKYTDCIAQHLTRVLKNYSSQESEFVILLDTISKTEIAKIRRLMKRSDIRVTKIRTVSEKSDAGIRLADTLCGLLRDFKIKNSPLEYKQFAKKIVKL